MCAHDEMVVLAGDMNCHVGNSNSGYSGIYHRFVYGRRNADGSRILEFADGFNLVVCNTLFMKQEAKLVSYASGCVKSTVDYILVTEGTNLKLEIPK